MHRTTTREQLEQLVAKDIPVLTIFTKIDLVPDLELQTLEPQVPGPFVGLHTQDQRAIDALKEQLIDIARRGSTRRATALIPYDQSELSNQVYAHCRVLKSLAMNEGLQLEFAGPRSVVDTILKQLKGAQ